jgi:uncharacterized alkaline shock family protein YloU
MTDAVENAAAQPAAAGAPGTTARGGTLVSEEVVEKIAAAAAREVPGVADLGGDVARFFDTVLDRIGLDEVGDARRGVAAEVKGTDVVINVVIVIEAGHVVHEVTEAVRVKVIEAVEKYGLRVTQVNIKVDDIELDSQQAAEA